METELPYTEDNQNFELISFRCCTENSANIFTAAFKSSRSFEFSMKNRKINF